MKKFKALIGMSFESVEVSHDEILLKAKDKNYIIYHHQDCCEFLWLEDVIGDLDNLINSPILSIEKMSNEDITKYTKRDEITWEFHKFTTHKGSVLFRWCGISDNGCGAGRVDLRKCYS